MAHFPIEHIKAGGSASRAVWEAHGLRLVQLPAITFTALGPPFKAGDEVVQGPCFVIANRENQVGVWSAPQGDLLADDWTAHPIEAAEDPLA